MAALAMAGTAGCDKSAPAAAPPAGGAMPVTAAVAKAVDIPVFLTEIGRAVASNSVTITPQVSGKILHRKVNDGDDVKKGQLLFEIDPAPFQATLDQAKGALGEANAALDYANRDFAFVESLKGTNAVSQETYEQKKNTVDVQKAKLESAKAAVEAAQINLDYCKITSPIDGRTGARMVDEGNVVNGAGQMAGTGLLTVVTIDPIYVDFTVNESELAKVREYMSKGDLMVAASLPSDGPQQTAAAQPATKPTAAPGTDAPVPPTNDVSMTSPTTAPVPAMGDRMGKLTFLDNSIQDGSGTVKLRATLANPDHHFWPSQFVNVKLILHTQQGAILIPRRAVQISQTGPFVYVVKTADGKSVVKQTPVGLGQVMGDEIVIDSGVAAGDQVVVTGQLLIQGDGQPVMVVPSGPQAGPPGH